jgi:hypothetical protein
MNFSKILIFASLPVLLLSFWNRDTLPGNIDYVPQVFDEPRQSPTRHEPFDVHYKGIDYEVEPQFDYELHGMVVSFRHHDGNSRMHRRSNDKLNMLDVCVVWGDNVRHPDLNALDFWNGIFTCNVSTRDQAAWDAFDMYRLSNNHLISDDELIRDRVSGLKVGDQIRVRGLLAAYGSTGGGKRGTSTTRLDTGDGACETIYVEEFSIVRPARSHWRWAMYASLLTLLGGLGLHFASPYKPH